MRTATIKHLPQRTCLGCRRVGEKKGLIRLVRAESGSVEVDSSGRKAGRGAYLCARRACWDLALKKNRLEYALRTKLSSEDRRALGEYASSLPEDSQI